MPPLPLARIVADGHVLTGGGAMGALVRSMDWSQTALGPIETWPQSLLTTVSLSLSSPFPISIVWGPQHTQIYNDGYLPFCGSKHPRSMGEDFTVCWASAWPVIGAAFQRALSGETSFLEDQQIFINRLGYLEETFFTFSFSPIRDETGNVAGLFHPVTETTRTMLNGRRARALRDLSSRTTEAKSVDEVLTFAHAVFVEYPYDVPFAVFYRMDGAGTATATATLRVPANTPLSPDVVDLDRPSVVAAAMSAAIANRRSVLLEGLDAHLGTVICGPYPEVPSQAFVLPLMTPGSTGPLAMLVAGVSPNGVHITKELQLYS